MPKIKLMKFFRALEYKKIWKLNLNLLYFSVKNENIRNTPHYRSCVIVMAAVEKNGMSFKHGKSYTHHAILLKFHRILVAIFQGVS